MGSSESTGRSNGREEEEEEDRQPKNSSSGGGSMGAGTAVAIAAAGTVVAAWGISRMISSSTDTENKEKDEAMKIKTHGMEPSLPKFRIDSSSIQYESKELSIWSPPPPGHFKLNTDGACPHPIIDPVDGVERGPSGYAGILRDDHGIWVGGFGGFLGESDCHTAELHGIHKGLMFLDKPCYQGSILENDRKGAVELVTQLGYYHGKNETIINESRELANKNNITIRYIRGKNANRCADKLADMAVQKQKVYMQIQDLPDEIKDLYTKDLRALL